MKISVLGPNGLKWRLNRSMLKKQKKSVDSFPVKTVSNSEVTTNLNSLHLSYLTQSTEEITELILAAENFEEVKVIISFMRLWLYRPEQVIMICQAFVSSSVLNGIEKKEVVIDCLTELIDDANSIINYEPVQNVSSYTDADSLFSNQPSVKPSFTEADKVKMYNKHFDSCNKSADETKNSYIKALQEGKSMAAPFYKAYLDYLVYTTCIYFNFSNQIIFLARSARDFSFYPLDKSFIEQLGILSPEDSGEFTQFGDALHFIGSDLIPLIK